MKECIVTPYNTVLAVRYDGGEWIDPFGGVFAQEDLDAFDDVARGDENAPPELRVTRTQ